MLIQFNWGKGFFFDSPLAAFRMLPRLYLVRGGSPPFFSSPLPPARSYLFEKASPFFCEKKRKTPGELN